MTARPPLTAGQTLTGTLLLTNAEEIARVHSLIRAMDANGYGSKAAIFERLHALYPTLPGVPARSVDIFFDEFLACITPEAEAEALLDALSSVPLPFGVITNGSARQWRKLEGLGLVRRTSCLFVSETFGGMKAAWLHRDQPWPEDLGGQPDFVIGSVSELAAIVGLH